MSFCPTNDIHSVYLDNELPEVYKAEYEAHLKECPKCQKILEQMKSLHTVLQSDSASISKDKDFLDKSYDRLLVKMAYSKNTAKNKPSKNRNFGYIISAAAAAAVFALVLPLRLTGGNDGLAAVTPVISSVSSIPMGNSVGFNNEASIVRGTAVSTNAKNSFEVNNVSFDSGRSVLLSGNIDKSVLSSSSQKKSSKASQTEMIEAVNVLKPDIQEDETISIRITVPGINATPVVTEIELPVNVLSGRY